MKKEMVTIELDKYNAMCTAITKYEIDLDEMTRNFNECSIMLMKVIRTLVKSKISDYTIKMYDYKEHDLYDVCSAKYPISYTDYIALRDLGIEKETIVNIVIDKIAEIKERERNE